MSFNFIINFVHNFINSIFVQTFNTCIKNFLLLSLSPFKFKYITAKYLNLPPFYFGKNRLLLFRYIYFNHINSVTVFFCILRSL